MQFQSKFMRQALRTERWVHCFSRFCPWVFDRVWKYFYVVSCADKILKKFCLPLFMILSVWYNMRKSPLILTPRLMNCFWEGIHMYKLHISLDLFYVCTCTVLVIVLMLGLCTCVSLYNIWYTYIFNAGNRHG